MESRDRLAELGGQHELTGIDFVYVYQSQTRLDVHFLRPQIELDDLKPSQVRIYSPSGAADVEVSDALWDATQGVLQVFTKTVGGFSPYRLRLDDTRIDPYYNDVAFSFKANCDSQFDCRPRAPECPPEPSIDFPVDYRARDFWSFRRALLDFAHERYPDWKDRLEADAGVMLVEAMSALGDELAYYQDRVAREAYLETASQRRSLRGHSRLVDYPLNDGQGAATWLDFNVASGSEDVPAGTKVSEPEGRIVYAVGRGLRDREKAFAVDAARNQFSPHQWDEHDTCLRAGSTSLDIEGRHKAHLPFDDFSVPERPGKWVLLQTTPLDPSLPARAWMVRLIAVEEMRDDVLDADITRLTWEPEQATPFQLDLEPLAVRGNLVPATAGAKREVRFRIGPKVADTDPEEAIEREGPNGTVAYRFSLPGTEEDGLVQLDGRPEILVSDDSGTEWNWRSSLVGVDSSQPADPHFILEDGAWRRVVGYQRIGREIVHIDHASGAGASIRFGDGEFGRIPAENTGFTVTYRTGNGKAGNLPAGSLTKFDRSVLTNIDWVTNPLPGEGGLDPEAPEQVRQLAPDAFRAVVWRAVRPEDYAEAAERLAWVERAGASFRWTGSWFTAFVTPDPRGASGLSAAQEMDLLRQLDRFRQAGREVCILSPKYADLDLEITVCVEPSAYRGEVEERVLAALTGPAGFFSPDNFTFGTPLERSRLEAAIQAVSGVRAVLVISMARRGWFAKRPFAGLQYAVGADEVIRVEDNPLLPEHGSLRLEMKGGA